MNGTKCDLASKCFEKKVHEPKKIQQGFLNLLVVGLLYKNQAIDLLCKSIDWILYNDNFLV